MDIIQLVGGIDNAKSILASPLEIRSSHYNFKDKTYLAKLRYIQTKPWRLVTSPDPYEMTAIDEPNPDDLINLDCLSAAVIKKNFNRLEVECVIYDQNSGHLLELSAKGKAAYYTRNSDEAMKTTVAEALDIIVKLPCSDEERAALKILTVK